MGAASKSLAGIKQRRVYEHVTKRESGIIVAYVRVVSGGTYMNASFTSRYVVL